MNGVVAIVSRAAVCAALLLMVASGASAQAANAAEPPGYRAAIEEALAEYQALNFEEARALFARAHALFPNARTLRGLGMVEFERRNYQASAEYLQQALASRVRPLEAELRGATVELLQRAKGYLGEVMLVVEPRGASVRLDGEPIEYAADQAIVVQVGDHVFEVLAAGYRTQSRVVAIQGGERIVVRFALESQDAAEADADGAVAAAEADVSADVSRDGGPPSKGPWPLIVVGLGGAALIAGGVLVALAQADVESVEGAPKGTRWPDRQDAFDGSEGKSIAGFTLLGVGAAGVVAGLVWHFTGGGVGEESASVRFDLGPDRVLVRGRF